MKTVLGAKRTDSASVAAGYYRATHQVQTGRPLASRDLVMARDLNDIQALQALTYAGPGAIESYRKQGASAKDAESRALALTSATATRLALDGGRATVVGTAKRVAIAYQRVTDGDPCAFCAMLASRGPVYHDVQAATETRVSRGYTGKAGNEDAYHNGCACMAAPVYSRDDPWLGRAKDYDALWRQTTKGVSGKDALNAFRRAYTAQQNSARAVEST